MTEAQKPLNLMQRINRVRKAVDYIQKDKSVSTGQSGSYKAVTHDLVTAMLRDHLVAQGVVVLPSLVSSKMSEPAQIDPAKISRQWLYEAVYDFTFVNEDFPTETFTVRIEAHANDNADKAPGKALSYAKKYAMLKVFEIETGEDDESRVPEEFDIEPYIDLFKACATADELQKQFFASLEVIKQEIPSQMKRKEAQSRIIKAKDSRKAELSK